jgi:hypothetical protein
MYLVYLSPLCFILHAGGKTSSSMRMSSSKQVGDMLYIPCNEKIPADMVVLKTSRDDGLCFVETSQLDGYRFIWLNHVL